MEVVSRNCSPNSVLASSSLRVDVEAIFERAVYPERCLGMRFLFPVYAIPEVELQLCAATSTATLNRVRVFLERMGKTCFLRAGPEPLILTDVEREARRTRALQSTSRSRRFPVVPRCTLPDLPNQDTLCRTLTAELEASGGGASSSAGGIGRERDCVVCMDEERNCVLHPCHHLCTCAQCGRMLLKRQDACPVCRRHIASIFRVFHS
uniref:Putative 3-hydroxyacyl-coa dehydrogenase n=2 Tax=Ornithodoros turicata TaxID=34597 RepID=A0A2R5L6S7_9ACAR